MIVALIVMLLAIVCMGISLRQERMQKKKHIEKGKSDSQVVELDLTYAYQNPQWNSAIEKLIRDFENDHPDIKVNYEIQYEDRVYEDILTEKIARDELGDVVQLKSPNVYAENGILSPLTDEIGNLSDCVYEWKGSVYGVGAVETTSGIVYNRDLFVRYGLKEPESWEEFLAVCEQLKAHGITAVGVGGSDLWHMEYWVNHFFRTDVLSGNETWLSDCKEGTVSWTDAAPKQMMLHLRELFVHGYVNKDWQTTTDGSLTYKMSEGEVAMIFTGPWTASAIEKLKDDMELGWFLLPGEDGRIYTADNLDTFWAVTAECKEDPAVYEAAMAFLHYFYDPEHYLKICQEITALPLIQTPRRFEETALQKDVLESFRAADVRQRVYIGNEDTPEDFEKSMLIITEKMLAGEYPVEEALEKIQISWEKSVNQEGKS